jgi:hypothetical protein
MTDPGIMINNVRITGITIIRMVEAISNDPPTIGTITEEDIITIITDLIQIGPITETITTTDARIIRMARVDNSNRTTGITTETEIPINLVLNTTEMVMIFSVVHTEKVETLTNVIRMVVTAVEIADLIPIVHTTTTGAEVMVPDQVVATTTHDKVIFRMGKCTNSRLSIRMNLSA